MFRRPWRSLLTILLAFGLSAGDAPALPASAQNLQWFCNGKLLGDEDDDVLEGGNGMDDLNGGDGHDSCFGGQEADVVQNCEVGGD